MLILEYKSKPASSSEALVGIIALLFIKTIYIIIRSEELIYDLIST